MLSPKALADLERILELIESGKLPESAIPRMVYSGHKVLGGVRGPRSFKCVSCDKSLYADTCDCSQGEVFEITDISLAKWECVRCTFQWTSVDGYVCPKCGERRD